jgi:hypothetical protein
MRILRHVAEFLEKGPPMKKVWVPMDRGVLKYLTIRHSLEDP